LNFDTAESIDHPDSHVESKKIHNSYLLESRDEITKKNLSPLPSPLLVKMAQNCDLVEQIFLKNPSANLFYSTPNLIESQTTSQSNDIQLANEINYLSNFDLLSNVDVYDVKINLINNGNHNINNNYYDTNNNINIEYNDNNLNKNNLLLKRNSSSNENVYSSFNSSNSNSFKNIKTKAISNSSSLDMKNCFAVKKYTHRIKLILEGDLHICKLQHSRNVFGKLLNSKLLRRWKMYNVVLKENEIFAKMVTYHFIPNLN
jgi:hypothetical protein